MNFEFSALSEARNYRAALIKEFAPVLTGNVLEVGAGIGQITDCRVVCNEPKAGVWPSDHFGVYAELRAVPLPEPPPFDDAA